MKRMKKMAALLLVLSMGMSLTGCQSKQALTSEDFKSNMEEKGFMVADCTEQYSEYPYIEKVYIALAEDQSYQIEFYDLDSSENAAGLFANNKQLFVDGRDGSMYTESSVELSGHKKFSQTGGDHYDVLSQIDDTMIYIMADKECKSAIEADVKALGY